MRRRNSGGLKTPLIFCVLAGLLFAIFLSPLSTSLTVPASAISTTLGYNLSSDYVAIISGPDGKPIDTTYPIFAYPDSDAVYIQIDRSANQIVFAESDGGSGPGIMFDSSISPLTINIYRSTEQVNCNERRCQSEIKSTNPLTANGNESIKPLASYVIPDDAVKIVSSRNGNSFVFSTTNASGETTEETVQEGSGAEESSSSANTSCSSAASGLGWLLCPVANFLNAILSMFYSWMEQFLQINPLLFSDVAGASAGLRKAWSTFRNLANVFFAIYILIMIISQITGVGISNYGIKKNLPRVIVSAILLNLSFYLCAATVDITNVIGASVKELFSSLATAAVPLQQTGIFVGMTGVDWARGVSGLGILTTAGVAYLITQGATSIGSGIAIAGSGILMGLITILVTSAIAVIGLFLTLAVRQGLVVICVAIAPLAIIFYTLPNTKHLFDRWWKIFKVLILMYPICGFVVGAGAFASRIVLSTGDDLWTVLIASIVQVGPYFVLPSLIHGSINNIGKMQLGRTIGGLANGYSAKAQKALPGAYGLRRFTTYQNDRRQVAQKRREAYSRRRGIAHEFLRQTDTEIQADERLARNMAAERAVADLEGRQAAGGTLSSAEEDRLFQARRAAIASSEAYWRSQQRAAAKRDTDIELTGAISELFDQGGYAYGKDYERMVADAIDILNQDDIDIHEEDRTRAHALLRKAMLTKGGEGVVINALYGRDGDGIQISFNGRNFNATGIRHFNEIFQQDGQMQSVMATEDGSLNLLLGDLAVGETRHVANTGYRLSTGQTVSYNTLLNYETNTIGAAYAGAALKDAQKIAASSGDTLKRYSNNLSASTVAATLSAPNLSLSEGKRRTLENSTQYAQEVAQQATDSTLANQHLEQEQRISQEDVHMSESIRAEGKNQTTGLYDIPSSYNSVAIGLNRPGGNHIVRVADGNGNEKLLNRSSGEVTSRRRLTFRGTDNANHDITGFEMAPSTYRMSNGVNRGFIDEASILYDPAARRVLFSFVDDTNPNLRVNGEYDPETGAYTFNHPPNP